MDTYVLFLLDGKTLAITIPAKLSTITFIKVIVTIEKILHKKGIPFTHIYI